MSDGHGVNPTPQMLSLEAKRASAFARDEANALKAYSPHFPMWGPGAQKAADHAIREPEYGVQYHAQGWLAHSSAIQSHQVELTREADPEERDRIRHVIALEQSAQQAHRTAALAYAKQRRRLARSLDWPTAWWMEPNGYLHDVGDLTHSKWAQQNGYTGAEELHNKGWLRITHMPGSRDLHVDRGLQGTPIRPAQLRAIKDHALERRAEAVQVYGGDEAEPRQIRLARNENKAPGAGAAMRAQQSSNHAALLQVARSVLSEAGLGRSAVRSVLSHSGQQGIRPAVAAIVHADASPALARYAAAWMGLLLRQRHTTVFHPGEGEDVLHVIDTPQDSGSTAEYLRRSGVPAFTLEPRGTGTRAYVVNPTNHLGDLGGLAIKGQAIRLGAGSDAEARATYRTVIQDAEGQTGPQKMARHKDILKYKDFWGFMNGFADDKEASRPFDRNRALAFADWLQDRGDVRHVLMKAATGHGITSSDLIDIHTPNGAGDEFSHRQPESHVDNAHTEVRLYAGYPDYGPQDRAIPILRWRQYIPRTVSTTGKARTALIFAPVSHEQLREHVKSMKGSKNLHLWLNAMMREDWDKPTPEAPPEKLAAIPPSGSPGTVTVRVPTPTPVQQPQAPVQPPVQRPRPPAGTRPFFILPA